MRDLTLFSLFFLVTAGLHNLAVAEATSAGPNGERHGPAEEVPRQECTSHEPAATMSQENSKGVSVTEDEPAILVQLLDSEGRPRGPFRKQLDLFGIPSDVRVERHVIEPYTLGYGWKIRFFLSDDSDVKVDAETGKLVGFSDIARPFEVPPDLTRADAISEQQALNKAQGLLDTLGIPLNLATGRIRYRDNADDKPGDLIGACWDFGAYRIVSGYKCLDSYVDVSVLAYSGEIARFQDWPLLAELDPPVINISEEDAVSIGRRFLEEQLSLDAAHIGSPRPPVQWMTFTWGIHRGDAVLPWKDNQIRGRIVWLVMFCPPDGPLGHPVFLDCETGDIVARLD